MRILTLLLLLAGVSYADSVTLRDGRTVHGSFVGGDARSIRIAVGDRVETYAIGDVANVSFEAPPPPPPPAAALPPEPPPRVFRPEPPRPERRPQGTIPAGTVLTVRMVDSVDSERDRMGATFRASLDEPLSDP